MADKVILEGADGPRPGSGSYRGIDAASSVVAACERRSRTAAVSAGQVAVTEVRQCLEGQHGVVAFAVDSRSRTEHGRQGNAPQTHKRINV